MLLQFPSLASISGLKHALTTRAGGVSNGEFASLNLGFHVGDDLEKVRENRRILARELGFEPQNLVAAQQVHGDAICTVAARDAGRGALDWNSAIEGTDALVTAEGNLPLLILVADCAPILLVDPEKRVLAVVHAGWRGALAGIAGKTVARMQREFDCNAANILAGVGPCLGVENLEIGTEVAAQIESVDAAAIIGGFEKPHLDLRGMIARDLTGAGVLETHIEAMPFCPVEDARFYSHRGQKGAAGRFGIVAWWSE